MRSRIMTSPCVFASIFSIISVAVNISAHERRPGFIAAVRMFVLRPSIRWLEVEARIPASFPIAEILTFELFRSMQQRDDLALIDAFGASRNMQMSQTLYLLAGGGVYRITHAPLSSLPLPFFRSLCSRLEQSPPAGCSHGRAGQRQRMPA